MSANPAMTFSWPVMATDASESLILYPGQTNTNNKFFVHLSHLILIRFIPSFLLQWLLRYTEIFKVATCSDFRNQLPMDPVTPSDQENLCRHVFSVVLCLFWMYLTHWNHQKVRITVDQVWIVAAISE